MNDLNRTPVGADVFLHTEHRVAAVDERIFSGFLEHMGRAVYEGVFDPDNERSDDDGFRRDVLDALAPLRIPLVRYPGGNFVSNHRWRDAVGPVERRARRPDVAWRSVESHRFGTDEFMTWCDRLGTRPMMAVNLGTAGPAEAAELVEYCNLPPGTALADLRVANGRREPYGVGVWCLGNEMDGPWQAGHVPAATYAERALAAASLMKGLDPSIETVVCGSSNRNLSSYLSWDRTVLEHCWEQVDYISAHRYSRNDRDDTESFLAEGVVLDETLDQYRGLLEYVRAVKRSKHRVAVSFDEWNVWYREMGMDGGWSEAPHLLEEIYNLEDALVCAQYLHAFLRHADIVKVACLAQIVNVIAPILTRPDGILIQSIYWPFHMLRDLATGQSLRIEVRAPELATRRGDVPIIDAAATYDDVANTGCVSIVNRSVDRPVDLVVRIADRSMRVGTAQLLHAEVKAHNDWDAAPAVTPTSIATTIDDDGGIRVRLPAPCHVVLGLGGTRP
jgi:alpha-N-arabinofuranosidase